MDLSQMTADLVQAEMLLAAGQAEQAEPMLAATAADNDEGALATTSSAKVFHSPHEGHLPSHLGASKPQLRQKYAFLTLAMCG